ncbi:methyltransferase domain-containing protein [Sphingomonas sp.]|uniref:methyltransferase domain-containing protein n=1 Tax=Sphingomonas sp. TaxID=28214 RepID=UPI001B2A8D71|nr:methyltransferase domain-containing protein [Sphingomonas sp.]MBO9714349.1 methyltransferase domain-containing protein [Sphingomonas sp.]
MMTTHFSFAGLLRSAHLTTADCEARRGPSLERVFAMLREHRDAGHRAIRILDLGCGDGERLLAAVERAHELGFVAIEARGVSRSLHGVRRARRAARRGQHPTWGVSFEVAEPIAALAGEHDGSADLILLAEPLPYPASPLGTALGRVNAGVILAPPRS